MSPCLQPAGIKHIQKNAGTLLYYAIAINSIILTALGPIATQQSKATYSSQEVQQRPDY